MKSRSLMQKYYNTRTACKVLGCLMLKPNLAISREYPINIDDFQKPQHKALFRAINNLVVDGARSITVGDIETYMENFKPLDHVKLFKKQDGAQWINDLIDDAEEDNYKYYYNNLRKLSLLRHYIENGIDVSPILNLNNSLLDEEAGDMETFEEKTIEDIIKFFDRRNSIAKNNFIQAGEEDSKKAGDGARELYEKKKETPSYGMSWEDPILNTLTRGIKQTKFYLETRDSGMGKSRISMGRALKMSAVELWDYEQEKFVPNPTVQSVLYIGTEMELDEELEPIMWSVVSGVDQDRIEDNNLTKDEEKRVLKAIEIIEKSPLFLIRKSDFDLDYLRTTVEKYKNDFNIYAVILDYIEVTPALVAEYASMVKGMAVREDQILLNLSKGIKDICVEFQVAFISYTQTTDEARTNGHRDQRAVKGARSLPNKADVGIVTFEPSRKELELLEPIMNKLTGLTHRTPNICKNIYKNRGGKIKKLKIWGWQNLGNMEYYSLFCTNDAYEVVEVDPTYIELDTTA